LRLVSLAVRRLVSPAQYLVDFVIEQRSLPQERVFGWHAQKLEQHEQEVLAWDAALGFA